MIVTIDGPAGTGKSTVARRLAEVLGFQYLDTGAMYRMIALKVIHSGEQPTCHEAVTRLAQETRLDLQGRRCVMDGDDVSTQLRTAEVTHAASLVAQIPSVREVLVRRQRELASERDIVCEGRDQGTVAFPQAECKFFLTALPEERARRRLNELAAAGTAVSFKELLKEQTARDQRDEERTVAPLRPAEDAVVVDTTALALEEVVTTLQQHVRSRQEAAAS